MIEEEMSREAFSVWINMLGFRLTPLCPQIRESLGEVEWHAKRIDSDDHLCWGRKTQEELIDVLLKVRKTT